MAYSKAKISIPNVTGNIVITATAVPSYTPIVNILDTIGYTDGKRCKTSGYTLADAEGYTAFGEYSVASLTPSDILRIYLPNGLPASQDTNVACQLNNTENSSFVGDYICVGRLSIFGNIFNSYSYDSNTKMLTLTNRITGSSKTKFRISVQGSGADCFMTLNQEIPTPA